MCRDDVQNANGTYMSGSYFDDNAFTVKTLKDTGLMYTCIYIIRLPRLQQLAWLRYYWFLG